MIRCGFPGAQLFDAMMRGGPVPARVQKRLDAGGRLDDPMVVELSPDELIALRRWWETRTFDNPDEERAAHACATAVGAMLHNANRCRHCGGQMIESEKRPQQSAFGHRPTAQVETWPKHCANCGERG
jgi:hypothetical protein